ncbi:hypothetical protein [Novosphingobium sp.]|uniref:hypothetical protein n=1 Tax=Novosphingobium sp. TaxID=1874826 RepID=UPI003BAB32A3
MSHAPKGLVPPLLVLLLAACSASSATTTAGKDGPVDAVRVAMPVDSPAPPATRAKDAKGAWAETPDGARFGYPGEAPLLSLECHQGALVVTRNVAAPIGAAALFALQGSGYILRLPVDATAVPGRQGYVWQGAIPADDRRLTLFKAKFVGTLPGGGHIEVPASAVPGALVRRCAGT